MPVLLRAAVLALFAVGCEQALLLPDQPDVSTPRIDALDPADGWSGSRVRVSGWRLGADRNDVELTIGDSLPFRAEEVAADGSWLVLRVPEDATDGPVRVRTPTGLAVSPGAFDAHGRSDLASGTLDGRVDLRPRLEQVAWLGSDDYAVLDGSLWSGVSVSARGVAPAFGSLEGATAVASTPGVRLVILRAVEASPTCEHELVEYPHRGAELRRLTLPGSLLSSCQPTSGLALSDDGRYALVAGNGAAVVVDLAQEAPQVVAELTGLGVFARAAAAGKNRFVVTSFERLFTVALGDDGWTLDEGLDTFDPFGDDFELYGLPLARVAAARDGARVAGVTDTGVLSLVDLDDGMPTYSVLRLLEGRLVTGLALSPDGTRLAASLGAEGWVVVLDVSSEPPRPLGGVALEEPAGLITTGDGLFRVAYRGGVATLAETTGALVLTTAVDPNLGPPLLVAHDTQPVIETVSHAFARVVRLDANGLARLPGAAGSVGLTNGLGSCESAALRTGSVACTSDGVTWLPGPVDGVGGRPVAVPLETAPLEIAATTDDDVAVALLSEAGQAVLVVLDFRGAEPRTVTVRLGVTARGVHSMGAGRVFLPVEGALLEYEVAALQEGRVEPQRREVPDGAFEGATVRPVPSPLPGARFFLAKRSSSSGQLVRLDLSTGVVVVGGSFDGSLGVADHVLGPGGLRLWSLEGQREARRMTSRQFDPVLARVGAETLALPVPATARGLLPLPGGRLAVSSSAEIRVFR